MSKVRVPREVLEGIEAVRETGRTNMMDRMAVQFIANELEFFQTVVWLEDNRRAYAQGLFNGFEPVDGPFDPVGGEQA
jgi:post-segregation antitoxin (ccd killing protein)